MRSVMSSQIPYFDLSDMIIESRECIDPAEYFDVGDGIETFIACESGLATRTNIGKRLWKIAFKAIDFIRNFLKKVVDWLTDGGSGGKKKKPAAQICREIGIKKHEKKTDRADPNSRNFSHDAAESMYLDFIEGFAEDGMLINVKRLVEDGDRDVKVKGKEIYAGGQRAGQVVLLIINPKPIDEYIELFERMISGVSKKAVTFTEIHKVLELCKEFTGRPSYMTYFKDFMSLNKVTGAPAKVRINIQQLVEFQKKIDRMCKLGEEFDDVYTKLNIKPESDDDEDTKKAIEKEYLRILNDLSWACVNLQGGIHAISNGMKGVYKIDPGYFDTIDNPELLSKFAAEAIKTGMPNKYIVYNIFNICNQKMRGESDQNHPIMGFGRMTLLSEGDVVYKVAINEYGVRSNRNDMRVMDVVRGTDLGKRFAETKKTYHYYVNEMEKVESGSDHEPNFGEANRIAKEINEALSLMRAGFQIVDIKSDAFGERNGEYVLLDYGYIERTSLDAEE